MEYVYVFFFFLEQKAFLEIKFQGPRCLEVEVSVQLQEEQGPAPQ